MSVINEERNELVKRFGNKAVILIEDDLYSSQLLTPNARNKRLFPVHAEAVERLNATMDRHIRGNAQIYTTMVYKDVPREELIKKFWNGLIELPEFKELPLEFRNLELEQAQKLAPTSRFTIERLFEGFVSHVDEEAKTKNQHLDEYIEAAKWFTAYIVESCKIAARKYPEAQAIIDKFYDLDEAFKRLPKDKAGGDPYFIRTDRTIAGADANKLYYKDSAKVNRFKDSEVYYTMYSRIQNKGNTFILGFEPVTTLPSDLWLPEKNRIVQGDSRSWQFLLKNISDIITQIPKMVDPIFVGWADQDRKNYIIGNSMAKFQGNYLFDSFDATEYDASTDPENFTLGIHIMYEVCRGLGLNPDKLAPEELTVRHYLHDATLTPWGAFERDSTPSGHNFTGPNGTITNLLRCYVQTKRLLKVTFQQLNEILRKASNEDVSYFAAVGDDAYSLRDLSRTADSIADENNSDGFKNSDSGKIVLSDRYIHFLQVGYYYDGSTALLGYYPVSRVVEHGLFQERADQYTAEEVTAQAIVQNINNARYNPCQNYLIEFFMEGDVKYRLGSQMGVLNLFRKAAGDRTVSQFLGREWDPSYSNMSWDTYSEVIRDTVKKIESIGRKYR